MTTRRAAAAVICSVSTIVGLVAAMPATAAHSRQDQPSGVYVAHEGLASRGNQPASFVYDDNGGEHLVTVKARSDGNGNIVYRTRKPGASKWVAHAVPGVRPLRHLHIEAHLSSVRNRVFVVFYQCNGVYAIDAPLKATRLHEPLLVKSESNCGTKAADPYVTPAGVPEQRAAAMSSFGGGATADRFAILLYDSTDLVPNTTTPVGWTLYSGTPSANASGAADFAPTAPILAANSTLRPQQVVLDPRSPWATIIATGNDGRKLAVFAIRSKGFYGPWKATDIASLGSATANYTVESSIGFLRRVFVGLQRPASFSHKSSLYLVNSGSGGTWSGAFPLPHSRPTDTNLLIAKNTFTDHLHAVFTRHSGSHRGVMAEMQPTGGGWTKPTSFSHSRSDRAIALYVTPHGRNVIAYRHH